MQETVVTIPAHKSEFEHRDFERKINVFIKEPDGGINENTGIFLIIHAAGGYADNPYFIKIREDWSNRYNVAAIGVNYMGTMQDSGRFNSGDIVLKNPDYAVPYLKKIAQRENPQGYQDVVSRNHHWLELLRLLPKMDLSQHIVAQKMQKVPVKEREDYRDYGYIQTMDCIYAVKYVIDMAKNKGTPINTRRIFVFGSSLGGYIAQLCAKFAPNTFSLIADNSGFPAVPKHEIFSDTGYMRMWVYNVCIANIIEPFYEKDHKDPYHFSDDMFKIRTLNDNAHLNTFKQHFKGRIIMFHAKNDALVPHAEKLELWEKYKKNGINSIFHSFGKEDIDGKIIKSDSHGGDADLKLLFEKYCDEYALEANQDKLKDALTDFDKAHKIVYPAGRSNFIIDYQNGYPTIEKRKIQRKK